MHSINASERARRRWHRWRYLLKKGALFHQDISVGEDGLNGCSLGSHMSLSRDLFKGQFEPVVLEILVQLFRALGYLLPTIFCEQDVDDRCEWKGDVEILLFCI